MLAGDIKKNVCLRIDGRIYVVIDFLHVKPGKGNTVMRTKLRDVADGRVLERTWIVSAKLEEVQVDHRQFQFLYKEGEDLVFMNNETFEQVNIPREVITGVDFLKEGDNITVKLLEIDQKTGKFRLSHRVLEEKPEGWEERPRRPRREAADGERRPRREKSE